MASVQKYLLRVYINSIVAIKLTLTEAPESVEDLKNIMRQRFTPRLDDFEFTLHYEDPDFDGQLSELLDIAELPQKGTLKVVRSEGEDSSTASSDTDILPLPHVPLSHRQKSWPDGFPVPSFSYEVNSLLEEGNSVYEQSGKVLALTKSQKHNILEKMAEVIHSFKAYPNDKELEKAAEALTTAHPCLKERASDSGYYGWKVSLRFKMGNYRTQLARNGCMEVSVNTGKRSKNRPDNEPTHSNIKKARHAEVNYLPNFPRGETQASLEEMKAHIQQEMEKTERDQLYIDRLMTTTFALRRREVVHGSPRVKDFLDNWPALRTVPQVKTSLPHRPPAILLTNNMFLFKGSF